MLIPSKHSGYQAGIRIYPGGGGKGGSSAPAPDPRLVSAQIESMGYQNKAIQQMMKNSEDMAPLQREQLQFGLDSARTAYGQSQEDRTWMLDRRGSLSGLQDQLVSDARGFNEGDRANVLGNQAMEDINRSFSSARGMTDRAMASRGISANSGAALAAMNDNSLQQAVASASAGNKVREAARQEGYALTDRATNALAGYPAMGMSATGSGAGFGASGVGMANSGLTGMNSGWGAASGAAGSMGSNAAGMYGAMGSYKNGQDQIAASNDPMNSILGAATGVGMSYALKTSDRRLKKDITKVGALDNGLSVYSYRYKSGGPFQIGVMADEVAQVVPAAYVRGGAGDGFDAVDYSKL